MLKAMRAAGVWMATVMVATTLLGCGPDQVASSTESDTSSDDAAETGFEEPRWCVEASDGSAVRVPMTELDNQCDAELTAEACEANPACTAVFGRAVECSTAGACTSGAIEFLGCVPFTICKPGAAIYCREQQGHLLTYASQQGGCTPFWMMSCVTSPDYAAEAELPPDCE